MIVAGPITEGDIVRLNKCLLETLHNDTFTIEPRIKERSLATSGREYIELAFNFKEEGSVIRTLFFKDYAGFSDEEKEELKQHTIRDDADIDHLAFPGLEGLWLVNPEKTHPIFIASPSAAGKDELFNRLKRELGGRVAVIPRFTTRPQRVDEINQTNLIFISRKEMRERDRAGELAVLEENYGGALYGVSRQMIDEKLRQGKIVIVVGNAHEGLESFVRSYPDATTVFVSPLPEGLTGLAKNEDPESRRRVADALRKITAASIQTRERSDAERGMLVRLARAQRDMKNIAKFDHVFSNTRDPLGAQGDLFESNYRLFRDLMVRSSRQGSGAVPRSVSGISAAQLVFATTSDPTEKKELMIRWLRENHPQARGLIEFFETMAPDQANDLFSRTSRLVIAPSQPPPVRLFSDERILSISDRLLVKEVAGVRAAFFWHFCFDLAYDGINGAWEENDHFGKGTRHFDFSDYDNDPREKAIAYLEGAARGEFGGLSPRHQEAAGQMLEAVRRDGFISVFDRATVSDDWYERRLAQETLSRVEPWDPEREQIRSFLIRGMKDRKGQQITIPAMRGLIRLGGVRQYEAKLLEADRNLSMPWARKKEMRSSVIEALGVIDSAEARQAIMKDIAQDSFYGDAACVSALSRFPLEQAIDVLIFELSHPLDAVRAEAKKSLIGLGYLAIERLVHYYPLMTKDARGEIVTILGALPNQYQLRGYLNDLQDPSRMNMPEEGFRDLLDGLAARGVSVPGEGFYQPETLSETARQFLQFNDETDFKAFFALTFHAIHDQQLRYAMRAYFREHVPEYPGTVLQHLARSGYKYREMMIEDLILLVQEGRVDAGELIDTYVSDELPSIRSAMARLLPYLPDNLFRTYAPRLLGDTEWSVRKECLYGILTRPSLVLTESEISLISAALLDDFWVNRNLAMLILRQRQTVDLEPLRKALSHKDPRYAMTAEPLIPLLYRNGFREEALSRWREFLVSPLTFVSGQAADALCALGTDGAEMAVRLLSDDRAIARREAASVIRRVVASQSLSDDVLGRWSAELRAAAEKEPLGFVRAAFYAALGACMRREPGTGIGEESHKFLSRQLLSDPAIIARWGLLETLQAPDPIPTFAEIRREEEIKERLVATINDFNRRLSAAGQDNRIVEAVLMDNSYDKPYAEFITGSDLDFFRVVYTGDIPLAERANLRDTLLDLGIYLEPDQPQWTRLEERDTMSRSATDVVIYKDGHRVDERSVNNDWLEAKTTLRSFFFRLIDQGVLLPEEIVLSKKIYRATALTQYYHIDTPLVLQTETDLFTLISLVKQGLMSIERVQEKNIAVRGKWFMTMYDPLPILFGGKPLTVADFNRAEGAYPGSLFYKEKKKTALRPLALPLSEEAAECIHTAYEQDGARYGQILNGTETGFDTIVVIVRDEPEAVFSRGRIEQLKREGKIPEHTAVLVTAVDGSLDTEGSTRRFVCALGAAKEYLQRATGSASSGLFDGKRIAVLDFGRTDAIGPFAMVKPKDTALLPGGAQPNVVWALAHLSGLAATMPAEGGVILADMSSLPVLDSSKVVPAIAGLEAMVFSGDVTQAKIYGVHVTNGNLSDEPFAFQKELGLTKLNEKGLVFYQGKNLGVRNVDLGLWRASSAMAERLASAAGLFSGGHDAHGPGTAPGAPCDIPLSKLGYAFSWGRDRFTSFGNGQTGKDVWGGIWDIVHGNGAWKIANAGFARRLEADELEVFDIAPRKTQEICEALNAFNIVCSMTMDTRVGPGSPLWEPYSAAMGGMRAIFEGGPVTAPYGIEKPVKTMEEAEIFAHDPTNRAPYKTIHFLRTGAPGPMKIANFTSPDTMRYINDPESDFYKMVALVHPNFISAHLGYAVPDLVIENRRYRNAPGATPLTQKEIEDAVVAGIDTIESNLKTMGLAIPVLIEGLAYQTGESPSPCDHVCEPDLIHAVLNRTNAGLLIDCAHIFVSGMSFAAEGRARDYMSYVSSIVNEKTIGRIREVHISVPVYSEERHRWEDSHASFYEDSPGKAYTEAVLDHIIDLREQYGVTTPLIINFESSASHANEEAVALGEFFMSRKDRGGKVRAPEASVFESAQEKAKEIHAENLKSEYMPIVADKTILCHIITDSILPLEQRDQVKVMLEQAMEKSNRYREGVAFLSGANTGNPSDYIQDLEGLMQKTRRDYLALGYTDVRFDVACPNTGLVNEILGRGIGIKEALAFEPCKAEFNFVQVEGIMLALRALHTRDIGRLKSVFALLAGRGLSPEHSAITDIDVFIRTVPFELPAAAIEDNNKRRDLNDLDTTNIKRAA